MKVRENSNMARTMSTPQEQTRVDCLERLGTVPRLENVVYIYGLVDPRNENIRYIGKTVNPRGRYSDHLCGDDRNIHKNNWVKAVIRSGFYPTMIILDTTDNDKWEAAERKQIARYRPLYDLTNYCDGGQGFKHPHRRETKDKLSAAKRGGHWTESQRAKMSGSNNFRYGTHLSEEHKKKIGKANQGRKLSLETRKRISQSQQGKHVTEQARKNLSIALNNSVVFAEKRKKRVYQYTPLGEYMTQYQSVTEAAHAAGVTTSAISLCCVGQTKSSAGFLWSYQRHNHLPGEVTPSKKAVYQYTPAGELIKKWNSMADAARFHKLARANIGKCCQGRIRTLGGYVWSYVPKDSNFPMIAFTRREVTQLGIDGIELATWGSASEAGKATGANKACICACCKGRIKTAGGYVWRYT